MKLNDLIKKKLLFITGKGGVGKTAFAAAIASEAARSGMKVCLVESTAENQIAPMFGCDSNRHQLIEVAPNIFNINLDPELNFRDFIVLHLGFASLFDKVFSKGIVRSFVRMIPGIAELTLLGRLFYFCELEKQHHFDLIILDGYASGHFLSLLSTPKAILDAGFVGPIVAETQRVHDYINDNAKCGIVLVNNSEALVLNESIDFIERLKQVSALEIEAIVINRVLEFSSYPEGLPERVKGLCDYLSAKSKKSLSDIKGFQDAVRKANEQLAARMVTLPEEFIHPEPFTQAYADQWLERAKYCSS